MQAPRGRGSASSLLLVTLLSAIAVAAAEELDQPEVVLVGPLSRVEIEQAVPEWIEEQMRASPDLAATERLLGAIAGSEVTIVLGTWCEDSRREISRLWRAFDEAGTLSPDEISYVGVDREKEEPRDLIAGLDLRYVPTVIVRRQGLEVGRVVEEAPNGIEVDLAALLGGEKSGLITARDDL